RRLGDRERVRAPRPDAPPRRVRPGRQPPAVCPRTVDVIRGEATPRTRFPAPELEQLFGVRPLRWQLIESGGYGQVNAHWRVELGDGRSVVVEEALSGGAADWPRRERGVYAEVDAAFMPAYSRAPERDGAVSLAIEDL